MTHRRFRQRQRRCARFGALLCAGALSSATAFAAQPADSAIRFRSGIVVDRASITLSDVADLASLPEPLRQRAAALVMIVIAPSATTVRVDARRLAEAARRGMPMLAPWLADVPSAPVDIVRHHGEPAASAAPRRCVELLVDLPAATSPSADQVRPADCPNVPLRSAWRYDATSHLARAVRDLTLGERVPSPAASRLVVVRRGGLVLDTVQVGAVTVTRSGTSLTDAGSRRAAAVLTGNADIQMWRPAVDDRGYP